MSNIMEIPIPSADMNSAPRWLNREDTWPDNICETSIPMEMNKNRDPACMYEISRSVSIVGIKGAKIERDITVINSNKAINITGPSEFSVGHTIYSGTPR